MAYYNEAFKRLIPLSLTVIQICLFALLPIGAYPNLSSKGLDYLMSTILQLLFSANKLIILGLSLNKLADWLRAGARASDKLAIRLI